MNLSKLFETQAALDEHIMQEHPELVGQNNLDWKILALQVELGECANEWRGFKKWSKDQKPRNSVEYKCRHCNGTGAGGIHHNSLTGDCNKCAGEGEFYSSPLLEEYVDCLHFILSIGLEEIDWYDAKAEIRYIAWKELGYDSFHDSSIIRQFNGLFLDIGTLYDAAIDRAFDYQTVEDSYGNMCRTFTGLGEMLGFTWEQIEQAYYDKNKINHERQESGY